MPGRLRKRRIVGAVLLVALMIGAAPAGQKDAPGPQPLVVPTNGTIRVQMTTKRPIRTINNTGEDVVNVRTIPGETTAVLLIGMHYGKTAIEMIDVDGRKETRQVIVEVDAEYLRGAIRNEVPDAKVVPILMSDNKGVVLSGTVATTADAEALVRVMRGFGLRVINALRIGVPDKKYRVKVTVTESRPGGEDRCVIEPGLLVAESEEFMVQKALSHHQMLVTGSVTAEQHGKLHVSLKLESVVAWAGLGSCGESVSTTIETGCGIAPGEVIRVKMAKAASQAVTLTVDVRVEQVGKKSGARVHRLDFVSGGPPASE